MKPVFIAAPDLLRHPPGETLILEAGYGAHDAYLAGHIPGAVYTDTAVIERPPLWNRLPGAALRAVLPEYGVVARRPVVVYGRASFAAARLAAVLLHAGVRTVRLLDGGLGAWRAAGGRLERGAVAPEAAPGFGGSAADREGVFIDQDEVHRLRAAGAAQLVSVRTWSEYIGETSGYADIAARGRIANALWGAPGRNPDRMEAYHLPDGRVRPLEEIEALWRRWGIAPEQPLVFYCGTGWRASAAYLIAREMGWERVSIYDGGWREWSAQPGNPVESGAP